jgi:hypothetical protein
MHLAPGAEKETACPLQTTDQRLLGGVNVALLKALSDKGEMA